MVQIVIFTNINHESLQLEINTFLKTKQASIAVISTQFLEHVRQGTTIKQGVMITYKFN